MRADVDIVCCFIQSDGKIDNVGSIVDLSSLKPAEYDVFS